MFGLGIQELLILAVVAVILVVVVSWFVALVKFTRNK